MSSADLLPGYYQDPASTARLTLPWPGDRALAWNHPDRIALLQPSLGPQIIRWCHEYLVHHLTGNPWQFMPAQRRFIILWYAVRPDGRWAYRSGVKRGAKGTGKRSICCRFVPC